MKLKIKRGPKGVGWSEYDPGERARTLLEALYEIKERFDASLNFDAGCRSGICGACAVRVNGKEVLACSYRPSDGDRVEPLNNHPVARDLRVVSTAKGALTKARAYLHDYNQKRVEPRDEERTRIESDCILCGSCHSACPVPAVNGSFIAPFALSRAYRYLADPREGKGEDSLGAIQKNGIWDCTLCGECTAVCPQGIDPKNDINLLRTMSLKAGYSDPSFISMDFSTPFGFDSVGVSG